MREDPLKAATLKAGLERSKRIALASEKRREEIESLIEARVVELMEAGPARSAAILDECDAALRTFAKWITAYREDIAGAKE